MTRSFSRDDAVRRSEMDANVTAPTITIDGVTSKPGEPITFAKLICGDGFPILDGHVPVGDEV